MYFEKSKAEKIVKFSSTCVCWKFKKFGENFLKSLHPEIRFLQSADTARFGWIHTTTFLRAKSRAANLGLFVIERNWICDAQYIAENLLLRRKAFLLRAEMFPYIWGQQRSNHNMSLVRGKLHTWKLKRNYPSGVFLCVLKNSLRVPRFYLMCPKSALRNKS